MKQIISYAIISLVIGLIVAYFTFNLNKEYVDLRYTLSEKIPTKFVETSPAETVQQLVVKNNGNIPATKIQIKIDGLIEDHDILKNLVSDMVEEHNSNGHFEAIYPSLPPDSQFSYIFKTSGGGITKDNLEIKHSKGKAKEALASDSRSNYSKISYYIFSALFISYFILLVFQARSMAIDHLESSGSYTNYYDYLHKKKPIYVSQEKWDSIRRKYIEGKIKPKYLYVTNIEEEENYKILNQDKHTFLTEDEWELLKENASKSLENQLSYLIKTSSSISSLEKYFLLKKPKHFPENKWQEIVKELNENFMTVKKLNKNFYLSMKDILKELELGMPSGMLPIFWDKYKKFLTDRYYELVYSEILRSASPSKYLKETNISILNKDEQKSLEDISCEIQQIEEDKSNLKSEKQKTNELKEKILKQLSIINNVLIEPESINKIEDYDNPFSEGNFANLKKISKLAIELKKTT